VNESKLLGGGLVLIMAMAFTPAQGASADPLAPQLKRCASLSEAAARLACYDTLAGTVAGSVPAGGATASATSAAPAPAATRSAGSAASAAGSPAPAGGTQAAGTGSAAASPPAAGAAPSAAEFGVRNGPLQAKRDPVKEKSMLAVVSRVSSRGRGELVVTLDNGQVWTQIQPSDYPLKAGDHVEIDVASLGSYVLWCPSSRRATKVTRIE
jgi:hypothetical protein